jgi:hypothetical protein
LKDRVSESAEFIELLLADIHEIRRGLLSNHPDGLRRSYLRAQMAGIEGATATLRRHALLMQGRLSTGEIALLEQRYYGLDVAGNVRELAYSVNLPQAFRFAFNTCTRAWALEGRLDAKSEGWHSLRAAVAIGNRVAYPKNISEVRVSNEDIETVSAGGFWVLNQSLQLILKVIAQQQHFKHAPERGLGLDALLPPEDRSPVIG